MIHHDMVQNYSGTLAELAEDIGNLRYDALAQFLQLLSAKINHDGLKDQERGRPQLATALQESASELSAAASQVEKAWQIARPFMPPHTDARE